MKYLFKLQKNTKQHLWDEEKKDTYCKMWSTNGMAKKNEWIETRTNPGREICDMCKSKLKDSRYANNRG